MKKKKTILFKYVKEAVEKETGYKYQANMHIVISMMESLTDLLEYGEIIIITPSEEEHRMKCPKHFSFYEAKHIKKLKQNCKRLVKFYSAAMYYKTGSRTDKNNQ